MPPPDKTIDDSIAELKALLRKCVEAGITATLTCDPVVVVGREQMRVRARFFASPQVLAKLQPVVRCAEMRGDGRPLKRTRSEGEYALTLPSGSFATDTTYHLTVHPNAESGACAGYALHTFSTDVAAALRSEIRTVLRPLEEPARSPARKTRAPRRSR